MVKSPSRSILYKLLPVFLVLCCMCLDESQYVPMCTLTEELGPHISELPRGRHVMDREPSFLN